MAVPTQSQYLRNTTGGAYTVQTQGGTVLGNTTTSTDRITKALALKDNAVDFINSLPKEKANGLVANQKALSGGTFAYEVAGQYVIASVSATLSGVSKTNILITSHATKSTRPIAKFMHDFGAGVASLIRANRFARAGFFNNGNKVSSRYLWLNAAGTAVAKPSTLTTTNMWDLADGNATNIAADSAAEPTRAVPGELVMKVDFVTLTVASGGDFFDYKAITGM
tara:strand:- start:31 stop:702 length:672 start_codon:yes stop_codon:yes gene_type:complete